MGKRSAMSSAMSSPALVKRRQPSHSRTNLLTSVPYQDTAADTWIAIGNCATTMGIIVVAIHAFELALAHAPGSVEALVGWSHLLRMNDININETVGSQSLIQRLTKTAETYPHVTNSPEFFRELTDCYLLAGLNEQAHHSVQQAIQRLPNDPALQLLSAQTLIRAGARAQAASALTHCLLLLPPSLAEFSKANIETARSAHAELAAIAAADGNIDALIAELTATLSLPPPPLARQDEHIALWCAFATAKERANRIPEALEACERAEVAVGSSPRILITHAYLLLLDEKKENASQAVQLLNRVVELEPQETKTQPPVNKETNEPEDPQSDFLPWYLLGKAHTILDAPRAAYDAYQIALLRASRLPITWLAVGKLYLELKQLPDALAAYSQALRLQVNESLPGTAAAWDGLSCVYERCDDQLADAADASSRAASCFRAVGDSESAAKFEERTKSLRLAASGEGPVPALSQPIGLPNYFLRDLVTLLPSERITFVQNQPPQAKAAGPAPQFPQQQHQQQQGPAPPQLPVPQTQAPTPQAQTVSHNQTPQPQPQLHPQPNAIPQPPHSQQVPHAVPPQGVVSPSNLTPVSGPQLPPTTRRTLGTFERSQTTQPPPPHIVQGQPPHPQPPQHPQMHVQQGQPQGSPIVHTPANAPAVPAYFRSPPGPPHMGQPHDSYVYPLQYNPLARLPDKLGQQLPPPNAHAWSPQEHVPQPHQVFQAQGFPQPQNGIITPPPNGHGPPVPPLRSPMTHPHMAPNGYPVPAPPGYMYGQYMPMHGGMVAHVQPYAGTNKWKQ